MWFCIEEMYWPIKLLIFKFKIENVQQLFASVVKTKKKIIILFSISHVRR